MSSKAIASALNQIREAKNSTSRDKQQGFDINEVFTQGAQGEMKYAEYVFNYELPRIASIAASLENKSTENQYSFKYTWTENQFRVHLYREPV